MPNGQNPQQYNNMGYDNPFMVYFQHFGRQYTPKPPVNEQELLHDFAEVAAQERRSLKLIIGLLICLPFIFFTAVIPTVGAFLMIALIIAFVILFIYALYTLGGHKGSHGYTMGDYKNYVIRQSLSPIVENLVYDESVGVPQFIVKNMDITKLGNIYSTEDLITGKYHGVYFAQSDIQIGNRNKNNSAIHFLGRWIDIKYPKPFGGMVTIVDRNYAYKVKSHSYLQSVTLENLDFNNSFIIESNNQQLAYYLLTPQIMEKLLYIKQHSRGEVIACFMDGYLHIGINNYNNAFEPNVKNINLQGDIEKTKYDFSLVSGIIEILSIDRNIYIESQKEQLQQQQAADNMPTRFIPVAQQNVQQQNAGQRYAQQQYAGQQNVGQQNIQQQYAQQQYAQQQYAGQQNIQQANNMNNANR